MNKITFESLCFDFTVDEAMERAREDSTSDRFKTTYSVWQNRKTKKSRVSCYEFALSFKKEWRVIAQFKNGEQMM